MFDKLLMAAAQPVAATDSDQYIANTELLLKGEGSNGQTNNTFVDSSASNHSITPYNDVTQGSFSPFSPKGWSGYFDGTNDYLSLARGTFNLVDGSDFTVEAWIYMETFASILKVVAGEWEQTVGNEGWLFYVDSSGKLHFTWKPYTNSNSFISSSSSSISLNTWHHVAVSKNGSNFKLFVDGQIVASGTHSGTATDTALFTVGFYGTNTNAPSQGSWFDGYISNLRVIKGTALYTAAFTPPTEPLTAVTNTKLLTLQDNRFIDNSASNHSITVSSEPAIKPTSPFSGDRTYPKASYFSGKFDGSNDYLDCGSNSDFAFGTGEFTVEAWVYSNGTQTSSTGIVSLAGSWQLDYGPSQYSSKWGFVIGSHSDNTYVNSSSNVVHNQWTHLAASRDSNNVVRLFVDGVLNDSQTISTNLSTTGPLKIGVNRGGGAYFNGYISNARVVKGTALYTTNFTPPTAPLTPVANTKLLTLQDNYLVDHSSSGHSITNNGGVTLEPESPFSNSTYPLSGPFYSANFDSTNDALSLSASSDFVFGTGDFTWECWFNRQSGTPDSGRLVQIGPSWGTNSSLGLGVYGSNHSVYPNKIFAYSNNLQSGSTFIQSSITIADNEWHHVAVTRNNGVFYMYVDGVLRGSNSNYSGSTENVSTNTLHISGNGSSAATPSTENFLGFISNARIVKGTALYTSDFTVPSEPLTAVSGTKLLTLQDATIQDNSASSHSITNNGVTVTEIAPFGAALIDRAGSMYFDGSDHLNAAYNSDFDLATGDFTMEAWLYIAAESAANVGGDKRGSILSFNNNSPGGWEWTYSTTSNNLTLGRWGGGGYIRATVNWKLNQWYHVAAVRSGSNVKLFINGVEPSYLNSTFASTSPSTNAKLFIGRGSDNSGYYHYVNGYLSDVRFIKGTALYTSNFTPPTAPLQPITNTKLLLSGNNGGVEDSLGKRTFETDGNAQIDTSVKKFGSGAIEFDGNGDYLKGTGFDLSGKYTIEGWIYRRAQSGHQRILVQGGSTWDWASTGNHVSMYFKANTNTLVFELAYGQNSSPWVYTLETSTAPAVNTWHYFAVTCDGTNTSLFLNGTRVGTTPNILPANWPNGLETDFSIGNNGGLSSTTSDHHFNGFIDDFRVTVGVARYDPTQTTHTVPTKTHPTV